MSGESVEVTVARLGGIGPSQYGWNLSEEDFDMPWRDREKTTLTVSTTDTLGTVLNLAANELGLPHHQGFIGFHDGDDDAGFRGPVLPTVALVDDQGRASWLHPYAEVTMADLLRSSEAGALSGDALKPYLVDQPQIGDGEVPDWETVKAVWDAVNYVLEAISAAGGTAAALYGAKRYVIDRLRSRTGKVPQTIERKASDWRSRNGSPVDLQLWLDDRSWFPQDVARLLDCGEDEAEAVLGSYGFGPSPSGLWHKKADSEAEFLEETTMLAMTSRGASRDEIQAIVRRELDGYLRSGEVRPMHWEEVAGDGYAEEPEADDVDAGPPVAEERGGRRAPWTWARDLFKRD